MIALLRVSDSNEETPSTALKIIYTKAKNYEIISEPAVMNDPFWIQHIQNIMKHSNIYNEYLTTLKLHIYEMSS